MSTSHASPPRCDSPRSQNTRDIYQKRSLARTDPDLFISLCFTDTQGKTIRQAAVHRELQAFLSTHPKALVELPRDHGKSFQVCCRILWELGRNPGLRVKVVCATEAVAAERPLVNSGLAPICR